MAAENFNGGWGGQHGPSLPYEEFDALPWAVRRLFCFAAYDYSARVAWVMLEVEGRALDRVVNFLRGDLARQRRREVLRLYGPTHPQAGA